jgi:hypothetical protein
MAPIHFFEVRYPRCVSDKWNCNVYTYIVKIESQFSLHKEIIFNADNGQYFSLVIVYIFYRKDNGQWTQLVHNVQ